MRAPRPCIAADLSCEEAEALLPLVADGALDHDGDPRLFAHLAGCDHCQRSLARHDLATVALASAACATPRPSARRIEVLHLRLPWPLAAAGFAAATLAVGGGWWLVRAGGSPSLAVVPSERPDREVFPLGDGGGAPELYMIRQGDRVYVLDPSERPSAAHPVKLQRY